MAAKYFSGNATAGKVVDGYTFVFEAVDVSAGSWYGVFTTEDAGEQAALMSLAAKGQIKELTEEQYEDSTKKKAERQSLSPHLRGVSETQGVDHVAATAPKVSVEDEDDILEVKQVAKTKKG
tara:strand:- start:53 stop:418 length:366 start_codon:yes stop_codon:yes gene_type:complete